MASANPLRPEHFERVDETDDALFYADARLVTHIDDAAISALGAFYDRLLPTGGRILDLMSSCVSHLADASKYAEVVGLGMNAVELEANPQLASFVVHDLNRDPSLPFEERSFDAAILTVSVQYLVRPVEVFASVGHVLRPGAPFAVAYSNRLFPTKAVAIWRALDDSEHADLIGLYFRVAGGFSQPKAYNLTPQADGYTDPLYLVVAHTLEEEAP